MSVEIDAAVDDHALVDRSAIEKRLESVEKTAMLPDKAVRP